MAYQIWLNFVRNSAEMFHKMRIIKKLLLTEVDLETLQPTTENQKEVYMLSRNLGSMFYHLVDPEYFTAADDDSA